ncbi:MAG: hypothetical protein P4L99_08445 [Chthoniobacter sp.]|nr:hypothetical protein [Chthoniobacter sp.]
MPNSCLQLSRYDDTEYTTDLDLSGRLTTMQASPKDAWQYVLRSCDPERVQANMGRVQQAGAEAYAVAYESIAAKTKAIFISFNRNAVRNNLIVELDKGIAMIVSDPQTQSNYEIDEIVALIRAQLPEDTKPNVFATIKKTIEKHGQLLLSTGVQSVVKEAVISERPAFLEQARHLESHGYIDRALDAVYAHFDTLLRAHNYSRVDELLNSVEPKDYGIDLLLGFLTITLPARRWLKSRSALFEKTEKNLRSRKEWEENLLAGLEQ